MSFEDAKSHCQSHGKRLCTMEEWKIACGATRFTYGETYDERSAQPINQIRKDTPH